MGNLRVKSRSKIEDALKTSKFTRHAFNIKDESRDNGPFFEIIFLHDEGYVFKCFGGPNSWTVECAPGEVKFKDNVTVNGQFDNVVGHVRGWIARLDEDVDLLDTWSPHIRAIKEQLESYIRESPEAMSGRFTADEILALLAQLKTLETAYEALLAKQEITEEELVKLRATIDELRNELSYVTRGTWFRLLIHRNLDVAEGIWKTPAVRQLALEAGKTFVQEKVKTLLGHPPATS